MNFSVVADITEARTLDRAFYLDEDAYRRARERIFARAWHWTGDLVDLARSPSLVPVQLLPGLLDEPLVLVRDVDGALRCLSNVCTHRGNILVAEHCHQDHIRCGYHSRRFDLSGRMTFMPEFGGARDFPGPSDDLANVSFESWAGHGFAALDPLAPLETFIGDMFRRMAWLPLEKFTEDRSARREYTLAAHWALYVENYLEGLHIPFVHPRLSQAVEFGSYTHELYRYSSVQIARAQPGEEAFAASGDGSDADAPVAAYYWWIFPNLMFNFYPWGLSVNLVCPAGIDRSRISFRAYVWDESRRQRGAGAGLDEVEMEDERVVEAVQRGVRARLYRGGRYSPTREAGVHQFHRLICEAMR